MPGEEQMNTNRSFFDRTGSGISPKDPMHKSPDEIKRGLWLTPLGNLLLWLAKTDLYVLSISTYESRGRLMSLGAMVIFTALLAFSTAFYTLSSTLIGPEVPFRYLICFALVCIYTFGIIIIDREIVGATSKSYISTITRLVFAVFIALSVSYPAKLLFFNERIDQEINQIIAENNADKYERIDTIKNNAEAVKQQRIANIQARIDSSQEQIAVFDKQIKEEQARGFCGPKCQGYILQKEKQVAELKEAENAQAIASSRDALSQAQRTEIEKLEAFINSQHKSQYDILFKSQALNRITASDSSAALISNFMIIFFLLLELVPLVLKWSMGFSEYHYYLEARNRINKQKIVSITNHYMGRMQEKDENVFEQPREITDLFALVLEDESRHIDSPEDMLESLEDMLKKRKAARNPGMQHSGIPENESIKSEPPSSNQGQRDPETLPES